MSKLMWMQRRSNSWWGKSTWMQMKNNLNIRWTARVNESQENEEFLLVPKGTTSRIVNEGIG